MGKQELNPAAREIYVKALREFAVFAASDWQFLISAWSARDYAEERLHLHYENASRALDIVERLQAGETIAEDVLNFIKGELVSDRLFPGMAADWYGDF